MKLQLRLTAALRTFLRRNGYEVSRTAAKFLQLLTHYHVDIVFDVGANVGQFGSHLRRIGYAGRIASFEPLAVSYASLAARARNDSLWETYNIGLADYDGIAIINRSRQTVFSSIAQVKPVLTQIFDGAAVEDQEQIEVRRLDTIFDDVRRQSEFVLLKCDTQGTEKQILEGASTCLNRIAGLHLELSYEPLYEGQLDFDAMVQYIKDLGFELILLEPLLHRETDRILQSDGTFFRPAQSARD